MKHKLILLLGLFLLFSAFTSEKPKITVFMIGDSTMSDKSLTGGNPERGWGHVLPGFFSEDIIIDNHAQNGRSSKSFIDEGRLDKVLSLIKKEIMFLSSSDIMTRNCQQSAIRIQERHSMPTFVSL